MHVGKDVPRRVLALMGVDALVSLPLLGGAESAVIARLSGAGVVPSLAVLPLVTAGLAVLSWWARGLLRSVWRADGIEGRP